jgi:hypothetical protein
MKIRQFANLPNIKALNIVAVSTLALGIAATMNAAPAQAVVFSPAQQLSFNGFTRDFFQNVNAGSNFSIDFNGNATSDTSGSPTGTQLGSLFNGNLGVTPSTGSFTYIGGTGTPTNNFQYQLASNLTFAFANNISYTVGRGSVFNGQFNNGNQGIGFGITTSVGSFFTDRTNGDITVARTDSFNFGDIPFIAGTNTAGTYGIVASPTAATAAVPEPFTIIGTIIGGTAAFRMRKKLASKN